MTGQIEIRQITGADIANWLPELASLRIQVFREFPYLYDGSIDYERKYLRTYVDSVTSIAVLALDGDRVVGVSTGLALKDEDASFVQPFLRAGYDINTVFYCAESVLLPEYRGQGLYKHFFDGREMHARTLPGMSLMTFCAIQRPDNHPRRPAGYTPLDSVWQRFGYTRRNDLTTEFSWRDLDEASATPKSMVFYTRNLKQRVLQ